MSSDQLNHDAGVLCHISSLPSGNLGADAYQFVDFLANCGVAVWQTLPVNMPHADNSPYQCLSAHAGNPAFINLHMLQTEGLLTEDSATQPVDTAIASAYECFKNTDAKLAFDTFCQQHAYWLDDFAFFLVLREQFNQAGWFDWPDPYKHRDQKTLATFSEEHAAAINIVKFTQFLFFEQWAKLKQYAQSKQVLLFGDIPIFVAYDSAEVWAKPHLFKLDDQKQMTVVAGVPPDYFSETGQRWGNPHYNWEAMAEDGFTWWLERLHTQSVLFDLVRIDHFRGLESAWEIPADEETAINGEWVLSPGDALLAAIKQALPDVMFVAEDLGIITEEVDALRLKYDMPGMKILQFAFGGDDKNPYLPEQIEVNSVVYTGTHDNDTTLGWYHQAEPHVKAHLHQYLDDETPDMPYDLMKLAMSTQARLAIVPMQDVLALDSDSRMNTPGTIEGNWSWQFNWTQLTEAYQQQFKQIVTESGRSIHD